MPWQDLVLMLGSFALSIALVPSIRGPNKPAWASSLLYGLVLLAFTFCYFTLELWAASFSSLLVTALWFTLFFQVVLRK